MPDTQTLSDADKLLIAKDVLRGLETDQYRISLLAVSPAEQQQLTSMAAKIEKVQAEVEKLSPVPVAPEPQPAAPAAPAS